MMISLFRGDRIHLRAFDPEDVNELFEYVNDPALLGRRYLPWVFSETSPLSKKQCADVLDKWEREKDGLRLAVVLSQNGQMLGHASCDWEWDAHSPNIGLVIRPGQQRMGYGTETLQTLLAYLFSQTAAHNVSMWMADWNHQAIDFAKRNGFQSCGGMRWAGMWDAKPFDAIVMDLLRTEWYKLQAGGE